MRDGGRFDAWCLRQTLRIRWALRDRYHAYVRRQMAHDAALERRRRFEVIAGMLSPGIAKDIAEWRVER